MRSAMPAELVEIQGSQCARDRMTDGSTGMRTALHRLVCR